MIQVFKFLVLWRPHPPHPHSHPPPLLLLPPPPPRQLLQQILITQSHSPLTCGQAQIMKRISVLLLIGWMKTGRIVMLCSTSIYARIIIQEKI